MRDSSVERFLNNDVKAFHFGEDLLPNVFHDIAYNLCHDLFEILRAGVLPHLCLKLNDYLWFVLTLELADSSHGVLVVASHSLS